MRFDYLDLIAFGHFTDYKINFDRNKNFHLLYGPNEAGKSTILRAVSNFLYGFPQQTADSFLHSNQKLRIGGQLRNKRGEALAFIRRKGRKNTVLDVDNEALDESIVNQFLKGLPEQQFLTMFALDHIRLREGGESLLHSDGDAGESLFAAASGINVLRNVLDDLEETTRGLYLKSGSKPPINQALRKEKELTKEINENQLKVQEWKDLRQEYRDGENKIKEIKDEIQALRMEEKKYNRLKQTLPKIAYRKEVIEKLKALEETPDLPDDAEETRKESIRIMDEVKAKQKDIDEKMKQMDQDLENLSIPEELILQEAKIEGLNREIDSYRSQREQLPMLQGEYRGLEQRVRSALKQFDTESTNLDAVEQFRIPTVTKKSIEELADRYPLLEQEKGTAKKEVKKIQDELQKEKDIFKDLGETVDLTNLEEAIHRVKEEGNIEKLLEEKEAQIDSLEENISFKIEQLPLWQGTSKELTELQVPGLKNTLKRFDKEKQQLDLELQQLRKKIEEEHDLVETNEEQIRKLESLADIPTEEVLQELRQHRDQGWLFIRNKLNEEPVDETELEKFTEGKPLDYTFEKSMKQSDDTADVMRREAEKLGEKNKLIADIKASKRKIKELEEEKDKLEQALDRWKKEWEAAWEGTTITPLSPDEMSEWLDQYDEIMDLISDQQRVEKEVTRLRKKRDEFINILRVELLTFSELAEEMSLNELIQKAERTMVEIRDKNSQREHRQTRIEDLNDQLEQAMEREREIARQEKNWNEKWEHTLKELTLDSNTSPAVVKEIIAFYDACLQDYDKLKQVEQQIKTAEKLMDNFKERVEQLEHNLPQTAEKLDAEVIVTKLYEALNKAKQDQVKLENLNEQRKDLEQEKRTAEERMKTATEKLEQLMKLAGCETLEELEKVEAAYKQKKAYADKLKQLQEELLLVGDGLSLEQILEEAETADADIIDSELEEIARKREELDQRRSEIEQRHGVVKEEYQQKIEGSNFAAVQAVEEKESVLATIADLADEYINHKLASLLLKKGIEFYRQQNQSPIIKRASEIFHQLTLSSFDGITVDFDEKDKPVIMGVRNRGEKVKLSGLSDGTTDQLYLALRIASIEKYVFENEPIPFIVDDILIHFDDERSKETLKILLGLSEKTQVIFFTHHLRLTELMRDVAEEDEFQQIELQHTRSSVLA